MDSCHTTKSCVFILLVALLCAERCEMENERGLDCSRCLRVPLGFFCPTVPCSINDNFCFTQEIEVGKFPVAYIKMGEEGFGENIMLCTCYGPIQSFFLDLYLAYCFLVSKNASYG
uniref:Uncharacterized protein n=1 Tax=Mus spicilegus TaxID=10103 RepID=A0A8C6HT66_MUSSI